MYYHHRQCSLIYPIVTQFNILVASCHNITESPKLPRTTTFERILEARTAYCPANDSHCLSRTGDTEWLVLFWVELTDAALLYTSIYIDMPVQLKNYKVHKIA
jgi:hypothetical protein